MTPTGPDHEQWADAAGSYVLGALPDDELATYEAHLAACAECREEVEVLRPAVHALPVSVEPVAPPPALKARIMAEVEREAALLAAAGPDADRPPAAPRRAWWPGRLSPRGLALPRLAVLGTAAALLLGAVAGVAIDRGLRTGARTVTASMAAGAAGARAEVDVADGGASLVASGLRPAPNGRVYQVWLKRAGHAPEPTSALFTPRRDGSATATVPGSLSGVDQVMVTDEPAGGSQVPTGKLLLAAKISS
jgi:anti-sigma-K factor RskA